MDRRNISKKPFFYLAEFLESEFKTWQNKLPSYLLEGTRKQWLEDVFEDTCRSLSLGKHYYETKTLGKDRYKKSTVKEIMSAIKLDFRRRKELTDKDWAIVNETFLCSFIRYLDWDTSYIHTPLSTWLELKHEKALLKLPKTSGRKPDSLQLNQFQWIPEDKSKIDEFYSKLRNCMDSNTTLERFREAFSPYKSKTSTTPINWLYSLRELRYFIDRYLIVDKENPKLISRKNINIIIASQFNNKGEEITPKQISDAAKWQSEATDYPVIDLLLN